MIEPLRTTRPAPRPLPLFAWAREQRARRARQRWLWRRMLALALAPIVAGTLFTLARPPQPLLVWNASASAPIGLYAVAPGGKPARGQMVIAQLPAKVRPLAARRRYLPLNVPLVKRAAAIAGDRVCAQGPFITINGRFAAARRRADAAGRPLPQWQGCRRLGAGEVFLLMAETPESFDGRYFGISAPIDVIGRATPVWLP